MFAVVEFVATDEEETSNEIAVVPTKWLYKHDKRCYWPNRLGKFSKFDDFVKSNMDFKSTWATYKVYAVHYKTDNFEDAEKNIGDLLRDRNYESETTSSSFNLQRKRLEARKTLPSLPSTMTSASPLVCSRTTTPPATPPDIQQVLLEQVMLIKATVDQQSIMIKEILRNSRAGLNECVPDVPAHFPNIPFNSVDDFIAFDTNLVQDENTAKYLTSRLSAVGGSGLEHLVRRIMKTMVTFKVGCCFNWKGRGEKKPFEKTNMLKIIKDAAKLNFPPCEKNDLLIENTIKDWLKYSPTRLANQNRTNK